MNNELVKAVAKKPRACLCVVMMTATTASDEAVVSCQEEGGVKVGASAAVLGTGVTAKAKLGVDSEYFNQLTLVKGKIDDTISKI